MGNITINEAKTYFSNGVVFEFPKPSPLTVVQMENRRACIRLAEKILEKEFGI